MSTFSSALDPSKNINLASRLIQQPKGIIHRLTDDTTFAGVRDRAKAKLSHAGGFCVRINLNIFGLRRIVGSFPRRNTNELTGQDNKRVGIRRSI